ncbi:MAG: Grx4 family monothiol glutaredoxin [Polyangiaceae bacterium]|nr:Grx4 family monothiol glutaredoxin [Polyangiaceae bacterium]
MNVSEPIKARIEALIQSDRVVLFMKGNRQVPQCGFSGSVVEILDDLIEQYATVNVLEDAEIRDGIKAYSNWPTIPQLYIAGEFVGGADIVREMRQNGELLEKLGVSAAKELRAPAITVSEPARREFLEAAKESPGELLRFEVSPRFEYGLYMSQRMAGDFELDVGDGLVMLVDRSSARRANGVSIEFIEGPEGGGFKIENPNEPPRVRTITAPKLKEMLDNDKNLLLIDVRTERERDIASIEAARPLDREELSRLEGLPKDTPIAFLCHHGVRSRSAAEHFISQGFSKIYNVEGGIDAWSVKVDPSVPRY